MKTYENVPTLFTFNDVPVKARRGFWLMVAIVWIVLIVGGMWRWPGQSALAYALVAGVGLLLGMLVYVGHACAHTIGARMAHAPTALILLGADMPRTLYPDETVRPGQHIARSLGGPIYTWIGIGIGLFALRLTAPGTAAHYLAEIWTFASTFIGVGIFLPLPVVDGGVIIKWLLVLGGENEAQADGNVRRVDVVLAILLLIGGGAAALMGAWLAAAGLVALAAIIALVVAGIIQ